MIRFGRARLAVIVCVGLVGGFVAAPAMTEVADTAVQTVAIGVDHASPRGTTSNTLTSSRARVSRSTPVTSSTSDGEHRLTGSTPPRCSRPGKRQPQRGPRTCSPPRIRDDGASQLQFNPSITNPTHPPAGSGAPGSCGSATKPCVYNGSAELSSGANGSDGKTHFFVKVNVPAGTTVNVVCLVHRGMSASFDVVAGGTAASTPNQVATAAADQLAADTTGALTAEAAASTPQVVNKSNGTHTVTLTAGTATNHVEVIEMLPRDAVVTAGDTVRWMTTTIKEIHTVTLPQGNQPSANPDPSECEGSPDVVQNGPPSGTPCGNPAKFETHLDPGPVGPTTILSPVTVASSGLISTPSAPFPTRYSFTFPNPGTYTYQCQIHFNMTGTLIVQAPAATPIATTPKLTG